MNNGTFTSTKSRTDYKRLQPLYVAITNGYDGIGPDYVVAVSSSIITATRIGRGASIQSPKVRQAEVIEIDGKVFVEMFAVVLTEPNADDLAEQAKIDKRTVRQRMKIAVMQRSRAAGLSESDIETLMAPNNSGE